MNINLNSMSDKMIDQAESQSRQHRRAPKLKNKGSFVSGSSDHSERNFYKNLTNLIEEDNSAFMPYRSKFQLQGRASVSSNKSRKSRDSDLLNKLAQDKSKSSSKLRQRNNSSVNLGSSGQSHYITDKSGSGMSEEDSFMMQLRKNQKKEKLKHKQVQKPPAPVKQLPAPPPKIHNCVCFVAQQCLSYNCNCFLSPLPCTPECCPNCITLKSSLPLRIANSCTCKKTRCLKLYCECLSKGLYCGLMCRCELCQNHEHSHLRKQLQSMLEKDNQKGCSCRKTNCQKKYCQCYAQGRKCTRKCKCSNCNNYTDAMEEEQPPQSTPFPQKMLIEQMDVQSMEFQEPDFSMQPKKKKR